VCGMEGASGLWIREQADRSPSRYDEGPELLTADVNAVVAGAFDGGATEMVVCDGPRYESQTVTCGEDTKAMVLLLALDALLDWLIGGKDAPRDDLIWATAGVLRAIEQRVPLTTVL
jgi:hypothetical protein